jgi:hypothetical protein
MDENDNDNPLVMMAGELGRFAAVAAVIAALIMLIAFVGPEASELLRRAND